MKLNKKQIELVRLIEVDNGDMIPVPRYDYQVEKYCRSWKRTIDLRIAGGEYNEQQGDHNMLKVEELKATVAHITPGKKIRTKLLRWHYDKSRTIGIVDLLDSNYQSFRYRVAHRVQNDRLDFREAIKIATEDELWDLQNIIDEERLFN